MLYPDSMGEITEEDKELARAAWKHVEKDYLGVGMLLFKELFTAHPDYVQIFDHLKSSPEQDIFESPRFKTHIVHKLFPSIGGMLVNLDHPEELDSLLEHIAIVHQRRKLERRHFEALHKIMIVTFKKGLGSIFTEEMEDSWNKILSLAFDRISTFIENKS